MSEPYFELILDNKIYTQRTKNSKIIEFTLEGEKVCTYEELPPKIQDVVGKLSEVENNYDKYLKYRDCGGYIYIEGIKEDVGPYLRIPSEINNLPVRMCNFKSSEFKNTLEYIYMPDSIVYLGGSSFKDFQNLKQVRLSKSITEIPDHCFTNCKSLKEIDLSNIKLIDERAFSYCYSLNKINLPVLRSMGKGAFSNCMDLQSVNFNGEISLIPAQAFYYCSALKEVHLSEMISYLGCEAFSYCSSLEKINLEEVDTIEEKCFFHTGLKEFIASNYLQKLGESAFQESELEYVVLNKNLKDINSTVFDFCENIKEITLYKHQTQCLKSIQNAEQKIIIETKNEQER